MPEDYSVFGRPIRTNNDVEGRHHRLRARAGESNLHLYVLISLLHHEADVAALHVQLVSEGKLRRQQRKQYQQIQGKILVIWGEYRKGNMTASSLFRDISRIYAPQCSLK